MEPTAKVNPKKAAAGSSLAAAEAECEAATVQTEQPEPGETNMQYAV